MVKLHTSLLAITLATGSALACSGSEEFQRRSDGAAPSLHLRFGLACNRHDSLQSRGIVDEEDLFVRDNAFDDLEAREPGGGGKAVSGFFEGLVKLGKKIHRHPKTKQFRKGAGYASDAIDAEQQLNSRDVEDNENIFVRDIDAFDDLEAREPGGASGFFEGLLKLGKKVHRHPKTKQFRKGAGYASDAIDAEQQLSSRDIADKENIFVRDIDAFDDLEAREPVGGHGGAVRSAYNRGSRVYNHPHTQRAISAAGTTMDIVDTVSTVQSMFHSTRDLEDIEDNFVRDLEAEELFYGREYDFLDERGTYDDLD